MSLFQCTKCLSLHTTFEAAARCHESVVKVGDDRRRSMAEPSLRGALENIIQYHRESDVGQLAQLCLDLILIAGTYPEVKAYLDQQAVKVLDESEES